MARNGLKILVILWAVSAIFSYGFDAMAEARPDPKKPEKAEETTSAEDTATVSGAKKGKAESKEALSPTTDKEKPAVAKEKEDEKTAFPAPLDDRAGPSGSEGAEKDGQVQGLVPKLMVFMQVGVEWVLWILFAMGGVCLLLLFERFFYFQLYGKGTESAHSELAEYLSEGEMEKAYESFKNKRQIVCQVLALAIWNRCRQPEAIQEIVESRLIKERKKLERGLNFLGTTGSNAPFIGLFGTVLGIIKAFHDLALAEQAGPQIVMAGISEALVATAVGLLVAIPAVIIFNYFKSQTRSVISGSEAVFKLFLSRQLDICLQGQVRSELEERRIKDDMLSKNKEESE